MTVTLIAIVTLILSGVNGWSPCPPREDIYPCSCINISHGTMLKTTVVSCHRLPDSDSLDAISMALRKIDIDRFYLYDSFWEAEKHGKDDKRKLPKDWLSVLRIADYNIIDTPLSSCFACEGSLDCRNTKNNIIRFAVKNSSSTDNLCGLCDTGAGNKYSWTSCMTQLKKFEFTHGKLSALKASFFPLPMKSLTVLNLTHNQIQKIEPSALKNVPEIISLDLSHNLIQNLGQGFSNKQFKLRFLDLSWNMIHTSSPNIFYYITNVVTVKMAYNKLVELKKNDWKNPPASLRKMDFQGNPVHCDCKLKWMNNTFPTNVLVYGHCQTPKHFLNHSLRWKSNYMAKTCNASYV